MNITKLSIHGFNKFAYSKIKTFKAEFDKSIQIIIGTNGSGKSSLLHELFPYPPTKASFSKNGYKTLYLTHNDDNYELGYSPENGHTFIVNGTNKNSNSSLGLQRDLIKKYLGVDQFKQRLLKCSYSLSTMTPSQRKSLLFELNPINLKYLIDSYKKVHKTSTYYNNNISMLLQRKEQLLEKKLDDDIFKELLQSKENYEEQEKLLLIWITQANTILESLPSIDTDTVTLDHIKTSANVLLEKLDNKECFSTNITNQLLTKKQQEVAANEKKKTELSRKLTDLTSAINDLEDKVNSYKKIDTNIEEELNHLMEEIFLYETSDRNSPIIPEEFLTDIENKLDMIRDLSTEISHVHIDTILDITEIETIKTKIEKTNLARLNITQKLKHIKDQLDQITSMIKDYAIPDNCAKDDCELFTTYNSRRTDLKNQLSTLNKTKSELENELVSINKELTKYKKVLSDQQSVWRYVVKLQKILDDHPYIRKVLDKSLIAFLNESPYGFVNYLTSIVKESKYRLVYLANKERVKILQTDKKTKEQLSAVNIKYLNKNISEMSREHEQYTLLLNELDLSVKRHIEDIKTLNDHLTNINQLRDMYTKINRYLTNMEIIESKKYLNKVIIIMQSILNKVRTELLKVIALVDEQKSIIDRMTNEVNTPLKEIKIKLNKSVVVEKALLKLQSEYNTNFLNNIVSLMNMFLESMMSYPMSIQSFKTNTKLTFKFPVLIDDHVLLEDVSSGSSAQKCLIDLSFNLALIIILKLQEYPLYLDEIDSSLDPIHQQKLLRQLNELIKSKLSSQLFLVNHNVTFHNALDGDYIVLDDQNIQSVPNANINVKIN
jgi:DNA repair exonuclease SbcCD ATPase subunit